MGVRRVSDAHQLFYDRCQKVHSWVYCEIFCLFIS